MRVVITTEETVELDDDMFTHGQAIDAIWRAVETGNDRLIAENSTAQEVTSVVVYEDD
jgi:hypothetical protein